LAEIAIGIVRLAVVNTKGIVWSGIDRSRFLSAPAKKPRTVCGCQSVALMICSTAAPVGRFRWR
jgi:hypothetical protein